MIKKTVSMHPCFSHSAHMVYGRIHLPVAPKCNISCRFCDRKYDCVNESRPGVTSKVLSPEEALARLNRELASEPHLRVAGIAGPGEPLYNEETFETFRLIHECYPELMLCISSNGLLVEERLEELLSCGVSTLTMTISAVDTNAACRIYDDVLTNRELHPERIDRIGAFLKKQQSGLYRACRSGLTVKINTVLIPGINDGQVEQIARLGEDAGASLMNIMPLIPCGRMQQMRSPQREELHAARRLAGKYLPQFTMCKQCRADACGIPGLEEHLNKAVLRSECI